MKLGKELTGQRRKDTPSREGTMPCSGSWVDGRNVLDERINPHRSHGRGHPPGRGPEPEGLRGRRLPAVAGQTQI